MELNELLEKAKQGDENAFSELYKISYQRAFIEAMSFMKDEDKACEALQLSYIKIAQNIEKIENETTFYKWINTVVANTCKDQLRKRKEFTFSDYDHKDDNDMSIDVEDENREYKPDENIKYENDRDVVIGFINELPTEQRTALIMQVYDEMKISEIAEFFEVSESTIKSRLNYAKKTLKEKIEKYKKAGNALFLLLLIPYLRGILESYEKSIVVSTEVYDNISDEVNSTLAKMRYPESKDFIGKIAQASLGIKIVGLILILVIAGTVGMLVFGQSDAEVENTDNVLIEEDTTLIINEASLEALDNTYIEYLVDSLTYDDSQTSFYTNFVNNVDAYLSLDTMKSLQETGVMNSINIDPFVKNCEDTSNEDYILSSIGYVSEVEEVELQTMPVMDSEKAIATTENEDEYRIYIQNDHQYCDVLVKREETSFFGYTVLEYTIDNQKMIFQDYVAYTTPSTSDIINITSSEEACQYVFDNDFTLDYEDVKDNTSGNKVTVLNEGNTNNYGYYYQIEVQWEQGNIYQYYVFVQSGKIICLTDLNNDYENVTSNTIDSYFDDAYVVVSEYREE